VVFACRSKTPRADVARRAVERATAEAGLSAHVRHVGEVDDFHDLLAASTCVAFPVDDLYGKVDLPLVLLEALAMGIPTVVASGGPLIEIGAVRVVPPQDPVALALEIKRIVKDPAVAHSIAKEGKAMHARRFAPAVVARQHDDLYRSLLVGYGP
jgi:phosphatidylinositol alpha-1,6-mannosyltransferase